MLKNETPAPSFTLSDHLGNSHSLESYRGKPLVLLFFRGTFCPTTRKSLPAWQDFRRSLDDLGIGILAISGDTPENHAQFAETRNIGFPLLTDSDLAVSKEYGVYISYAESRGHFGEPALVVIDRDGDVAYSLISSGPKGLPEPGAVAPVLIYMSTHGGKY